MDDTKTKQCVPDYDAWGKGIQEVGHLPSPRFYFVVTVAALALVAWLCSDWMIGLVISLPIFALGVTAFIVQCKQEDNGQAIEESAPEPTDQSS